MEEVDDVIDVPRETLWAQAMLFACDVTNKFVTTSKEREKTPYESWFGTTSTSEYFRPFGAVGYARRRVRKHYKMATKRKKCVLMGIPGHVLGNTVSILRVKQKYIVEGQAVQRVDGPDKICSDGVGK